jgi:two-component system response regulator HydG
LLAENFLERIAAARAESPTRLSAAALDALMVYEWPGNVRELENALERAVVLTPGREIEVSALPERIVSPARQPLAAERVPQNPTLEVIERAYISWVLQAEGGNKTRAAEVLGIDPSTLYRKLAKYESESGTAHETPPRP